MTNNTKINSRWMLLLAAILLVASCTEEDSWDNTGDYNNAGGGSTQQQTTGGVSIISDMLDFTIAMDETDRANYQANAETVPTSTEATDYEDFVENFTTRHTVTITYDGSTATCTALPDSVSIGVNGADVVVTSSAKGVTYVLTGSASNGSFKMADGTDDKKFQLVLDGLSLTKQDGAAINIQPSKRCYLQIKDGTTNTLSTTGTYAGGDESQKGAIFSEGKLLVSGGGTLSISVTGMHGICSDDYVWIHDGDIDITTTAKDGIHANDSVVIGGGQIDISSYGDGIQVEETTGMYVQHGGFVKITASSNGADRSHGIKAEGTGTSVLVDGGALQVSVTDAGAKALKADGDVCIAGGKLTLMTTGSAVIDSGDTDYTASAGIKADGNVVLSGGTVQASSTGSGGKGISADGMIDLSGATVCVVTTGQHVGSSSGNRMGSGGGSSSSTASASPKGIKADGNINIFDGLVLVRTTGGDNAEGIESKATLTVSGGVVGVYAYDDGVNASKAIVQTGGYLYACGTNNDGIDSNGTISVSGGVMIGSGTSSPEEGIDIDNGTIACTGGIVISMGGSMNGTPPVTSGQTYVVLSGLSWTNGTYFGLNTNSGNIYFKADRSLSGGAVMVSAPGLTSGQSYTLQYGGSLSGNTTDVFGFATDGTYSGGNGTSVTAGVSTSGGGQPGGSPGGRGW